MCGGCGSEGRLCAFLGDSRSFQAFDQFLDLPDLDVLLSVVGLRGTHVCEGWKRRGLSVVWVVVLLCKLPRGEVFTA